MCVWFLEYPNNWYQSWFLKKRVFDPNLEIKVLKTCFWTYHRVGEDEEDPLVKLRRRTDVLHARTRRRHDCPRAQRATRSFFARLSTTEPGWPAMSSASQEPQQQFRTVTRHVTWPVSVHVSSCHVIDKHARFWHVIKGGPDVLTCLPCHHYHVNILSIDPVCRKHYFIWHTASSASFIDPKVWLIRSEPSKVRFGWFQSCFQRFLPFRTHP